MGIFEKELIMYLLGWLFRWIGSNEKNRAAKDFMRYNLKKKDKNQNEDHAKN